MADVGDEIGQYIGQKMMHTAEEAARKPLQFFERMFERKIEDLVFRRDTLKKDLSAAEGQGTSLDRERYGIIDAIANGGRGSQVDLTDGIPQTVTFDLSGYGSDEAREESLKLLKASLGESGFNPDELVELPAADGGRSWKYNFTWQDADAPRFLGNLDRYGLKIEDGLIRPMRTELEEVLEALRSKHVDGLAHLGRDQRLEYYEDLVATLRKNGYSDRQIAEKMAFDPESGTLTLDVSDKELMAIVEEKNKTWSERYGTSLGIEDVPEKELEFEKRRDKAAQAVDFNPYSSIDSVKRPTEELGGSVKKASAISELGYAGPSSEPRRVAGAGAGLAEAFAEGREAEAIDSAGSMRMAGAGRGFDRLDEASDIAMDRIANGIDIPVRVTSAGTVSRKLTPGERTDAYMARKASLESMKTMKQVKRKAMKTAKTTTRKAMTQSWKGLSTHALTARASILKAHPAAALLSLPVLAAKKTVHSSGQAVQASMKSSESR